MAIKKQYADMALTGIDHLRTVLFWGLVGIVAWAPLPLGSNRADTQALLANLLLIHGACTLLVVLLTHASHRFNSPSAPKPAIPVALRKAWPFLSLLLATQGWVTYQLLSNVSLYHPPTRAALHLGCGLAVGAFSVLAIVGTRSDLQRFIGALFTAGLFQGVFAGLALLSGVEQIAGLDKTFAGDRATGTFVNPNHLAGFLELTLGLGIGLVLTGINRRGLPRYSWQMRLHTMAAFLISPVFRVRLWIVLLVVVLVMTRSRTGNAAFFMALIAGGLLWFSVSRRASGKVLALFVSFVLVDVVIVAEYFGLDRLIERFEQSVTATTGTGPNGLPVPQRDVGRVVAAEDTWRMWQDNFIVGTGAGTFPYVYNYGDRRGSAPYRSKDNLTFNYAHNDYLEVGAEYGAIGFGLLGSAVVLSVYQGLVAIRTRKGNTLPALSLGCIIGIISLLIHGVADGNLQIPANALWFVVFLSLLWVIRYVEHSRINPDKQSFGHPENSFR